MTVCKSDKHRTFEQEAIPHMASLHSYAMSLTRNASDADDLVQETYLKAYRFWDRYELGTNIRAWLWRILKNAFINQYRHGAREPQRVDFDTIESFNYGNMDLSADPGDLQTSLFDHPLDDHLSGAVSSLAEIFRTPVILCDIEGLSYGEIAEFLNCPLGTVRSRLHRGRVALHAMLHQYARDRGYTSSM